MVNSNNIGKKNITAKTTESTTLADHNQDNGQPSSSNGISHNQGTMDDEDDINKETTKVKRNN